MFLIGCPTDSSVVEALLPEHGESHICCYSNDRDRVVEARDELHRMLNEVLHTNVLPSLMSIYLK